MTPAKFSPFLKQQISFRWLRSRLPEGFLIKSHFFKTSNPSPFRLPQGQASLLGVEPGGGRVSRWACPPVHPAEGPCRGRGIPDPVLASSNLPRHH